MTITSPTIEVSNPQIVVIAEGESASAVSNNKGHLFEVFIAKLLNQYGCITPITKRINVRSNGYELDIVTSFELTGQRAIAECKAYSSPLAASDLNIFYSKLCTERFEHADTFGWFIAIPGLTKDGNELATKISKHDKQFRLLTSHDIFKLVSDSGWIERIASSMGQLVSDEAILVTKNGVCALGKQLDLSTRLPAQILVRRLGGVLSSEELELLATTDYVGGLPVLDLRASSPIAVSSHVAEEPKLFTVVGSKDDFEYQFPAAPEFFVGRKDVLSRIRGLTDTTGSKGSVLVLNAQSGWGKSSLALRMAHQVEQSGGFSIVFDTRTAAHPSYVTAALRKALMGAVDKGCLSLPKQLSFASLQSTLATFESAFSDSKKRPVMVFFDQFENVFRNPRLTQEFRDLAIGIREFDIPILIGFSWKTDLVGLTEAYPFQLRDEIRGAATVINVVPFGPKEVGTLLDRLARAANMKLSLDLRQRLREYSQGLPWLIKKLASHILVQLQAGTSEAELLEEALNIERLFEQDLANLEAAEIEAIKVIAREAPVPVADVVERISPEIIQSLVNQRLVVRVGERLDTYWDTFREFLTTGKVAVEDTYILRLRPTSTTSLVQFLAGGAGEATSLEVSKALSLSLHVVFNVSRDLRQLGILAPKSGGLALADPLRIAPLTEQQLQDRVGRGLRRHKVFSKVQELLSASSSHQIVIDSLAKEMPSLFPAIEVAETTWRTYAEAFAHWLDYGGLIHLRGKLIALPSVPTKTRLLGGGADSRRRSFPQGRPSYAWAMLEELLGKRIEAGLSPSSRLKAANDLQILGITIEGGAIADETLAQAVLDPAQKHAVLRSLISNATGGSQAIDLLVKSPHASPSEVGQILKDAYGLEWAPTTVTLAGSMFRGWASEAGLSLSKIIRKSHTKKAEK